MLNEHHLSNNGNQNILNEETSSKLYYNIPEASHYYSTPNEEISSDDTSSFNDSEWALAVIGSECSDLYSNSPRSEISSNTFIHSDTCPPLPNLGPNQLTSSISRSKSLKPITPGNLYPTVSKSDQAFDWIENKINELRFSDNFNPTSNINLKKPNKLNNCLIQQLESKLFNHSKKNFNDMSYLRSQSPSSNGENHHQQYHCSQFNSDLSQNVNTSTVTKAASKKSYPAPNPNQFKYDHRLPPSLSFSSQTSCSLIQNKPPTFFAPHKGPAPPIPTAPCRESVYGMKSWNLVDNLDEAEFYISQLIESVEGVSREECISALSRNNLDVVAA